MPSLDSNQGVAPRSLGAIGEVNAKIDNLTAIVRRITMVLAGHTNDIIGPSQNPTNPGSAKVEAAPNNTMDHLRRLEAGLDEVQQVLDRLGIAA